MREEIAPAFDEIGSLDKDKQRENIMLFLEYPKCSTCRKAKAWHQASRLPKHPLLIDRKTVFRHARFCPNALSSQSRLRLR